LFTFIEKSKFAKRREFTLPCSSPQSLREACSDKTEGEPDEPGTRVLVTVQLAKPSIKKLAGVLSAVQLSS
jgi:hypothetical protein